MNKKIISLSTLLTTLIFIPFIVISPINESVNYMKLQNYPFIKAAGESLSIEFKIEEFQINNYTDNDQQYPSVAALSQEKFVVAWESFGQDGSGGGIYASVFNATMGANVTSEIRVNNNATHFQSDPSVAALSQERFVVAWESYGQDGSEDGIYARVFDATTGANVTSEFRVNNYITDYQSNPSVAALSQERFVITWESLGQDGSGGGIYASVFNATTGANVTSEFRINNYTTNDQSYPSVAALSQEVFVVSWVSTEQDGDGWGIYASIFNATTGANVTSEFRINNYTNNSQFDPSVAALSHEVFVVAWESLGQDGSGGGIYASVFNATTGANVTSEFRINNYTTNDQRYPSVATLTQDSFAVSWGSEEQDGDGWGIYTSVFNATTGANVTSEFRINNYTTSDQRYPSVAACSQDSFAVSWHSNGQDSSGDGVYANVLISNSAPFVDYPSPVNGSLDIGLNPVLQVSISDANGQPITVYFYDNTTGTPVLLGIDTVTGGGLGVASFTWSGRKYGIEYKWFVNVSDGITYTTSPMWSFTTRPKSSSSPLFFPPASSEQIPGYNMVLILLTLLGITIVALIWKRTN